MQIPYPHLTAFGEWQIKYAAWLNAIIQFGGQTLLDVGTAYGAHVKAMRMMGCYAMGCDRDNFMVENCPWPDTAPYLFQWDCTKSPPEKVGKFNIIHTHALLEHIPEEKIPIVLENLLALSDPWALHVHIVTIQESPSWQKLGDPDHVSIFPYQKWLGIFQTHGFNNVKTLFNHKIMNAETQIRDFLGEYKWGFFLLTPSGEKKKDNKGGYHETA